MARFLKSLKSFFCKKHEYVITHVKTEGLRKGTMLVDLLCNKCGSTIQTFHDLTETERINFRNPQIEELLIMQGYLEKKDGELLIRTFPKVANQMGGESSSITISVYGSDKNAFNEVVRMFCDEIQKQLGIKINPKEFIFKSPLKNVKVTKFTFPIPEKLTVEQKLIFNIIKKNVQLKIKGVKKYEGITLIGVKKMFINSSEIANLWTIIKNDEQLHNFDGPIFLNLQILFYTCVFDYDRFTYFTEQLDKYLYFNSNKVDCDDIKKRIIDAVDELSSNKHSDVSKKIEMSKKQIRDIINEMGKQGAVKLIYMRNYTCDTDNIKKKPVDFLKKLSNLMKFMQSTLNSEGIHKDFIIPIFELSTDIDFVSAYGCFAMINNKTVLDESVFRIEIPTTKIKEV